MLDFLLLFVFEYYLHCHLNSLTRLFKLPLPLCINKDSAHLYHVQTLFVGGESREWNQIGYKKSIQTKERESRKTEYEYIDQIPSLSLKLRV